MSLGTSRRRISSVLVESVIGAGVEVEGVAEREERWDVLRRGRAGNVAEDGEGATEAAGSQPGSQSLYKSS